MKRNVVVTGAAGFIGWHLVRALAARGDDVRATDVRARPRGLSSPSIDWLQADIRDTAALAPILAGADTVMHLASAHLEVNAPMEAFRATNVLAAERLVHACAAAGVRRLVHVSTVGVFGHVSRPPADEHTPTAPGNMYEVTKLEGEGAVRAAAAKAGIETVIVRPAWVYGAGCPRLAKLLRSVRRGRFVYVGSGSNLRHPIYIDDAVTALLLAATAPVREPALPYILAGPRWMTLRQLVDGVAQAVGSAPPRRSLPRPLMLALGRTAELAFGALHRQPPFSRRSLAFFENDNAFDTSAARRDLGFEPLTELPEGLRLTLAHQPEHGHAAVAVTA